jgi:uncharacterized membrane protein YqjE
MRKQRKNIIVAIILRSFGTLSIVSIVVFILMGMLDTNKWDSNVRIFCYCTPAIIFLAQIVTGYITYKSTVKELDKS